MPEARAPEAHDALLGALSRRQLLKRASVLGLAGLMLEATPVARAATARVGLATPSPTLTDATLQAFADTIIPGRKAPRTDSGQAIDPRAIAGVDALPGAVEADALALYHHREVGFDALSGPFLTDLEARSLPHGGDFLSLGFPARVQVCLAGLDFGNQIRVVWEAAAAVPFTAFCAAALIRNATAREASGYSVMGLPGIAPDGYRGFSYGRKLARERTRSGSLP